MARSSLSAFLVALALAVGSACGSRTPENLTAPEAEPGADVTVQVISRNFTDVTVYLAAGVSKRRLGIAVGNQTTVFKVPWSQVRRSTNHALEAESIGGADKITSDHIELTPGGGVQWILENGLRNSSVNVY